MTLSLLVSSPSSKLRFISAEALEILLDASLSESHNYNSNITNFPVENGANISDHVSDDPIKLSLRGFITNTPIRIFGGDPGANIDDVTGGDRIKTTFLALLDIRKSRTPFTLVTGLQVYENMLFSNITFPRTPRSGLHSLEFTAELQQIQTVESRTVAIPEDQVKEGSKDQAQSTKDVRKQNTTPPSAAVEEQSSILFDVAKDAGLI